MSLPCHQRFELFPIVVLVIAAAIGGCGGPARAKPVEPALARATLRDVLESWKNGKQPQELQSATPKVVVQDPDWLVGKRLVSYQILDNGEARDANLLCRVKLVVEDPTNGQSEFTATFVVGTDPVLTVFRDMFH